MSSRDEKKARIVGGRSAAKKGKQAPKWIVPVVILVMVGGAAGYQVMQKLKTTPADKVQSAQVGAVSYDASQPVQQIPIDVTQADGTIRVPLSEIKAKRLVGFTWKGQGKELPLLAYIAPSGKLVTAVSICEPCNGYTFRIEGNEIVCNVCGTRWDLENLRGVSGGCTTYPPDAFPNKLEGDTVVIPEANVANWQRRI